MQLNPFEIKAEIAEIINKLNGVNDFENYEVHYRTLDSQEDKKVICKLLFKEITCSNPNLIKFLLLRYCPKEELIEKLWSIIRNNLTSNQAKIFALDLLRDIDTNWTYEDCDKYLDNPNELIDSDTKKILDNAIINPEVQIDFLDFLNSLPEQDQIILLDSLAHDYSKDELANMVIPVFLSNPNSKIGQKALEILGNSKSQLAFHALNSYIADDNIKPLINKNLSILKISGIREDNTKEYYKNLLSVSKPYKFCITYPDGHGYQAVIFSRENGGNIQFVAIVIDDYKGIRDCFGFNEISKFECNAIIERFYRGQRAVNISPQALKTILLSAEKLSSGKLPYEYVCWKNLLADIEPEDINLNYTPSTLSKDDFEMILKSDYTDFWFLDAHYSDEFEEFIKLANKTQSGDFDKIINENINNIFYTEERKVWRKRILHTAILKSLDNDEKSAKSLFNLYNDENNITELFKNIVRKSLYEYYFSQKDEDRIKQIEDMWVNA